MEMIIGNSSLAVKHSNPFDEEMQIVALGAECDSLTVWNEMCTVICKRTKLPVIFSHGYPPMVHIKC
jgi:hypothetical protein